MLKVGIVRCAIVAEFCPATSCIKAVKEGKGAFEGIEAELVGFMTCGGCPGKKVTASVKTPLEKGANAIALSSCMTRGYPVDRTHLSVQTWRTSKKQLKIISRRMPPT